MGLRGDFEGKRVHFVFDIYDKRARCLDASAIATNTPIFGKLNQNPNTPCPCLPESVGVSRDGAIAAPCMQTTLPSFHRPA
jgi:hypothetical protein